LPNLVAYPRRQVLSGPSYAAAARRMATAAQLLAASKPPLEQAVLEVELALVTRGYGQYRTYPRTAGGGCTGAAHAGGHAEL
jgi:hypothetical protein